MLSNGEIQGDDVMKEGDGWGTPVADGRVLRRRTFSDTFPLGRGGGCGDLDGELSRLVVGRFGRFLWMDGFFFNGRGAKPMARVNTTRIRAWDRQRRIELLPSPAIETIFAPLALKPAQGVHREGRGSAGLAPVTYQTPLTLPIETSYLLHIDSNSKLLQGVMF